jgi:hypothetical protein
MLGPSSVEGPFCIFSYMDKQITWTVAAISEFAKAKALSVKQGMEDRFNDEPHLQFKNF